MSDAPNAGGKTPREVREMFARVAPRYDLLNHLLSLGLDLHWRAVAARELRGLEDGAHLLDVCAGTGDLAFAFLKRVPGARVLALDAVPEMLVLGQRKARQRRLQQIQFLTGDATRIPVADGALAAAGMAFGLRNVSDPDAALREMVRAVRPGGKVLVLEFSRPQGRVFAPLFRCYFRRVLPLLARAVLPSAGDAYAYLPQSVDAFGGPAEMIRRMQSAGLDAVRARPLTFGVAQLYVGVKPPR